MTFLDAAISSAQEAGGTLTDFEGRPWAFGAGDYFVASNGVLHQTLLELVAHPSARKPRLDSYLQ